MSCLCNSFPQYQKNFSLIVQQERQLSTVLPLTNIHNANASRTAVPNNLLCGFCGKYGDNETI